MNEKQPKKNKNKTLLGGIIVAVALIIGGFTASLFIEKIPNGYVGVVLFSEWRGEIGNA